MLQDMINRIKPMSYSKHYLYCSFVTYRKFADCLFSNVINIQHEPIRCTPSNVKSVTQKIRQKETNDKLLMKRFSKQKRSDHTSTYFLTNQTLRLQGIKKNLFCFFCFNRGSKNPTQNVFNGKYLPSERLA